MPNHKNLTMKKIALTLALFFCGSFAMAQKGSLWIGGFFDYTSSNQTLRDESIKTRSLNFYPYLDYYVTDTWSFYAGVGVNYVRQSELDNYRGVDFEPFIGTIRYFPVTDRFSFFADLSLSGSWGRPKDDLTTYSLSGFTIDLSPGVNYKLTDRISLWTTVGMVNYQTRTLRDRNSGQKDSSSGFTANFLSEGVYLGISFRL